MKESILDKIDNELSSKSKDQAQMLMLVVALLVAFLVYLVVFPMAQEYFDEKQNALNNINRELSNVDAYLRNNDEAKITASQNELNEKIARHDSLVYQNNYIDNKLKELSQISYNEQNWAGFLDSLTKSAKENGIKVKSISSKTLGDKQLGVHPMLDVNIDIEGGFHSVLKYINDIEESKMVVDLNGLDINSTSDITVGGDIKVSVWGIKH